MNFCHSCRDEVVRITTENIDLKLLVHNLRTELRKYKVEKSLVPQTSKEKKAKRIYNTLFRK